MAGRPVLHHTIHRAGPDADWVVLIHGAGVTAEIWAPQIDALGESHNLLLPELRGHGGSAALEDGREEETYSWESVSRDVLELMDQLGIERAHLGGISMGCLVARTIAALDPGRVRTMVLAGAIARLEGRARLLIALAHALKRFVPHLWLYGFYARILMPRPSHGESRRTVIRQARALDREEFLRWLELTRPLPALLERFRVRDPGIPTLFLMGDQDHMFLPGVRSVAAKQPSAELRVFEDCGHVCNVQRAGAFNRAVLEFLG